MPTFHCYFVQVLHVVQMNLHAITIYAFHYAGSVTMITIAMTTLMKEIVVSLLFIASVLPACSFFQQTVLTDEV